MPGDSYLRTSVSLLHQLRQNTLDQAAWREFVSRYGGPIYNWCRRWKLQEADAQDVTQTVLLRLAERLRTFRVRPGEKLSRLLEDADSLRLA